MDGGAADETTDISQLPVGARANAVVCGRIRRTGSQNILDFGTAPHTSWLVQGGCGYWRVGWVIMLPYGTTNELIGLLVVPLSTATESSTVLQVRRQYAGRYARRLSCNERNNVHGASRVVSDEASQEAACTGVKTRWPSVHTELSGVILRKKQQHRPRHLQHDFQPNRHKRASPAFINEIVFVIVSSEDKTRLRTNTRVNAFAVCRSFPSEILAEADRYLAIVTPSVINH